MPEPNGAPDWLDQAERDAKAVIERLYTEGRTALGDDPAVPAATPAPPVAPPATPPAPGLSDTAAAVLAAAAAAEREKPGEPGWPDAGAAHRRADGTGPR